MMSPLFFRSASAEDADALSTLALASKAHWGYSSEFLEACRDELTITPKQLAREIYKVAEDENGNLVGFYSLTNKPTDPYLQHMFLAPSAIGGSPLEVSPNLRLQL